MSVKQSAYQSFSTLLNESQVELSPAELQGLLIGHSCACADFNLMSWLNNQPEYFENAIPSAVKTALQGLQQMLYQEFTKNEIVSITLLLPNDDAPLSERVTALRDWSQSFLEGFGLAIGKTPLTEKVTEILEDLVAIASIEDVEHETEESERSYMEVSEYLRVVPLIIYAECGNTQRIVPPSDSSLH